MNMCFKKRRCFRVWGLDVRNARIFSETQKGQIFVV